MSSNATNSLASPEPDRLPDRDSLSGRTLLFVTGSLAEPALREVVAPIASRLQFQFEIVVPGVQVAALLHTSLLKRRLKLSDEVSFVILPGWCQGDTAELSSHLGRPCLRGPRDLYDLPEYFGVGKRKAVDLSRYSIEILAEINHATRMSTEDVLRNALSMAADGADLIDVGTVPGESSSRVRELVRVLRQNGLRVSIDSFDRGEVEAAVDEGAELILSCQAGNLDWVSGLGVEVVAIPDSPQDLASLDRLIEGLRDRGCRFRVDPIIEPIGMGFASSLQRYFDVRKRHPDVPMMMGTGNVTELSEVDSAGVNLVLAALCEELQVTSVLTTQVINWCRSSVAELNAARRLVHYAVQHQTIPKHLDASLVMLRDSRVRRMSSEQIRQMAAALHDPNFRIQVGDEELHLMSGLGHWHGANAFHLFADAEATYASARKPIEADHAFYLGYELARAEIAALLGKSYVQDGSLSFGMLGGTTSSEGVHPGQSDSMPDEPIRSDDFRDPQ